MDRGVWLATMDGVTKSRTQLSNTLATCRADETIFQTTTGVKRHKTKI